MLMIRSSWEMATVGHPLADLSNLLTPYTTATVGFGEDSSRVNTNFRPGSLEGLPTKEQNIAWYREVAGWDPEPVIGWGDAFALYRGTIIIQGIAARYAMRVASSAKALDYAKQLKPYAEAAWGLIVRLKQKANL
jgi:aminoglycoside phosphotransferase (APT) family kinase protein